ncbi:LuxR family transcriptional regulator, maltose regulon positive regulatory protein [Parafrankia irregularis]|uniref:LuxR family transcriptional regulator, maltose regulon positive regulatory protein n=1 Tax=Parafrankia irregularis TaxID=795642 RepID=A0A0S4QSL2_9ACTN|nr:LuxR C-terminal-related transcriptional regulator [Parafrankia irregularis]MBE3202621.1 LuxR family transcriptional regulator [Parafrankia sp. CH37]CUU57804.1 LuxR family transcriptional regulator, maltose regulon positive regulatory protein [Parafrankia irregularis]
MVEAWETEVRPGGPVAAGPGRAAVDVDSAAVDADAAAPRPPLTPAGGGLPALGARVFPPRPAVPLVSRPRLLERLDLAVEGPLTAVCAPAGTGKTVLLADWARSGRSPHPVVWLRVDPVIGRRHSSMPAGRAPVPPVSPVSLWSQILRGLRRDAALPCPERLERLEAESAGMNPEWFQRELVNQLAQLPVPAVLILDDAHLVHEPADIAGLELLVGEGAGHLRLVLAGRQPVLRVHRLRAEGTVTEIGAADLAFTRDETAALLAAHGLRVSEPAIAALWKRTEGWAVGLRLAAARAVDAADAVAGEAYAVASGAAAGAVAGDGGMVAGAGAVGVVGVAVAEDPGQGTLPSGRPLLPPELDPARGPRAAIADYLQAEVLADYAEPVRRFLLRTSVLERLTGPLAAAVAAIDARSAPAGVPEYRDAGAPAPGGTAVAAAAPTPGPASTWRGAVHLLREFARTGGFLVPLEPAAPSPVAAAEARSSAGLAWDWYRYNRMFALMLHGLLLRDPDEDPRELNLRAALWFAANDSTSDAARHALRAGDWWYLACLLVDGSALVDILFGGEPDLSELVAEVPAGASGLSPECDLVLAVAHLRSGRLEAGAASLSSARAGLPVSPARRDVSRRRTLVERIDVVELYRAELAGEPTEMIAAARRLLRAGASGAGGGSQTQLTTAAEQAAPAGAVPGKVGNPGSPGSPGGPQADVNGPRAEPRRSPPRPARRMDEGVRAVALCARGRGELWLGRLSVAASVLHEGAATARRAGLVGVETSCLGALALQYALRGRLRQAESQLLLVVTRVEGAAAGRDTPASTAASAQQTVPGLPEAHLAAAMVHLQRVNLVEAERSLAAARRAITPACPGFLVEIATVCETRLRLLHGSADEVRAARRMLAATGSGPTPPLGAAARRAAEADLLVATGAPEAARRSLLRAGDRTATDPQVLLSLARSALACADVPSAEEVLAPLLRADDGGAGLVAACVLGAVAAARRDDHARAGGLLARAVALAVDEGMVAPFVEAGDELLGLMTAHPELTDSHPEFVAALDRSAASRGTPSARIPGLRAAERRRAPRLPVPGLPASRMPAARHAQAREAAGGGTVGPPELEPPRSAAAGSVLEGATGATGVEGVAGAANGAGPGWPRQGTRGVTGRSGQAGRGTAIGGDGEVGRGGEAGHVGETGQWGPAGVAGPVEVVVPAPTRPLADPASRGASAYWNDDRVSSPAATAAAGGLRNPAAFQGAAGVPNRVGSVPVGPDTADTDNGAGGPGRDPRRAARVGSVGSADLLSERELAVLSYLPTMLTTAEIAAEMFVSVNTVKTHLKSIYRKLDVARRRDAVHRARALHLL